MGDPERRFVPRDLTPVRDTDDVLHRGSRPVRWSLFTSFSWAGPLTPAGPRSGRRHFGTVHRNRFQDRQGRLFRRVPSRRRGRPRRPEYRSTPKRWVPCPGGCLLCDNRSRTRRPCDTDLPWSSSDPLVGTGYAVLRTLVPSVPCGSSGNGRSVHSRRGTDPS